ncbi:hypothetical protein HYV43_01840 [Candidatus Micrarchaeota archaeon]|nr:hypothetical protein [Candidatus Micrarchaeota archaeon]
MAQAVQIQTRFKRQTIQALSSISMSASAAPQSEVTIPNVGALVGLVLHLTQSTTGTLTTAATLDYAIQSIDVKDRQGNWIAQNIRGRDLTFIETVFGANGINTSVATTSGSNQTRRYFIPLEISQKDQDAKLQVTIAPYSDMAASGATGGTVSLTVVGIYSTNDPGYTRRYTRLSQSIVSGTNRFGPNLPQNRKVAMVGFTVGTESNVTDVTFTRDGTVELPAITPADMIALDQDTFVSGHQTGRFKLPLTPFVPNPVTQLDVNGAGSDTVNWFLVLME